MNKRKDCHYDKNSLEVLHQYDEGKKRNTNLELAKSSNQKKKKKPCAFGVSSVPWFDIPVLALEEVAIERDLVTTSPTDALLRLNGSPTTHVGVAIKGLLLATLVRFFELVLDNAATAHLGTGVENLGSTTVLVADQDVGRSILDLVPAAHLVDTIVLYTSAFCGRRDLNMGSHEALVLSQAQGDQRHYERLQPTTIPFNDLLIISKR